MVEEDTDRLRLGLTVPVGLRVSVGVGLRLCGEETVVEGDRVMEGEPLEEPVEVGVRVFGVRVEDMDPVASAEPVRLTVGLPLADPERVGVPELEGDPDAERLRVGDPVVLGLMETVGVFVAAERVAVIVRVAVVEGDPDTVDDPDTLGDPDVLPELLGLPVVECDPVGLTVIETVAVAEGVAGMQAPAGRAFSTGPAAE